MAGTIPYKGRKNTAYIDKIKRPTTSSPIFARDFPTMSREPLRRIEKIFRIQNLYSVSRILNNLEKVTIHAQTGLKKANHLRKLAKKANHPNAGLEINPNALPRPPKNRIQAILCQYSIITCSLDFFPPFPCLSTASQHLYDYRSLF